MAKHRDLPAQLARLVLASALLVFATLISLTAVSPATASAATATPTPASPTWHTAASYPYPVPGLISISCASTTVCEAIAQFGNTVSPAIIGTTDDGITWANQYLQPGSIIGITMTSISCPTTKVCIAVGSDLGQRTGIVLGTTNGGATWTSQSIANANELLTAVSCTSAQVCEVVGSGVVPPGPVALGTTNGGATWAPQTLPPEVTSLTGLACVSSTVCTATGSNNSTGAGLILTTSNGGTTWVDRSAPASSDRLPYLTCINALTCMATLEPFNGSPGFLSTSDGGTTWSTQPVPPAVQSLSAITCSSATDCIALGSDAAPSGYANTGNPYILTTTNDGATWTSHQVPNGVKSLSGISCASSSVCVAVGTNPTGGASVISTSDSGTTWAARPTPTGYAPLSSVSCSTISACTAVGTNTENGATVITTSDAGATYNDQSILGDTGTLVSVSCTTATTCKAVGGQSPTGPTIQSTTDGGTSWVSEPVPSPLSYITNISCASNQDCTAIGTDATGKFAVTATTTTGGASWGTYSFTPPNYSELAGLSCTAPGNCEASLNNSSGAGTILGTINGGASWTTQLALPSTTVESISCVTISTCTAVGYANAAPGGAVILGTTNAGTTWAVQDNLPSSDRLSGVSCANTKSCVAVGYTYSAPLALSTNDGGTTWPQQSIPAGVGSLSSVSCATATTCQAVGSGTNHTGAVILSYSAPSSPANLAATPGNGQLSLSWSASTPAPAQPLTAYTVSVTNSTTSTPLAPVVLSGSPPPTSTILTGLVPGDTYTISVTASSGSAISAATTPLTVSLPAPYHPLAPTRICDTRSSPPVNQCTSSPLGQNTARTIQVTGHAGVPAGATAVVANVTATSTTAGSYLSIYPTGSARPGVSNLNFTSGQTVANLVTTPLSSTGAISIYNAAGSVNVIVDVTGYYGPGAGSGYTPLTPSRICDTRPASLGAPANQCSSHTLGAASQPETLSVQVTGHGGVPAGATAVVVNLTITGPTTASFLAVWPAGSSRPLVSNLNYTTGQTVANRAIVPLSPTGALTIFNAAGSTNAIIDVAGYYSPGATGYFTAVTPTRVCDTRPTTGSGVSNACTGHTPGTNATISVVLTGQAGIPSSAAAVVANLTVTNTSGPGYLTAYPGGAPRPLTSDIDWTKGQTVPNLAIIKLGPSGAVNLFNASQPADYIVDVSGWFTS